MFITHDGSHSLVSHWPLVTKVKEPQNILSIGLLFSGLLQQLLTHLLV